MPEESITEYPDGLPTNIKEHGFTVERKQVEHFLPVSEVFPNSNEGFIAQQTQSLFNELGIGKKELANLSRFFPYMNEPQTDNKTLLNKVAEAFIFTSGGHDVPLYNFGSRRMTDEQLCQVSNALRTVNEMTGGTLFEVLPDVVILPEGHPLLLTSDGRELFYATDRADEMKLNGRQKLGLTYNDSKLVFINEAVLSIPPQEEPNIEELPPAKPEESVQGDQQEQPRTKNFFRRREIKRERKLLKEQMEIEERAFRAKQIEQLPFFAGPANLEHVLIHELHHVLASWRETAVVLNDLKDNSELPPSKYADDDAHEEIAETGVARLMGGKYDNLVGPHHRQVYDKFLNAAHSKIEGPTIVTCQELDLRNLST